MKFRFTPDELNELEAGIFGSGWASDVRDIAIASGCNPVAVYMQCLARRLAQVPPEVGLPPLGAAGGKGSLNSIFMGVADSGGGKNVSWALARELAPFQENLIHVRQTGVGTGESLVNACVEFEKGEKGKRVRKGSYPSVLSVTTEARQLDKELARDTSKAGEILCDLWSGAYIGAVAAGDPDRWVEAHSVRWVAVMMIQPANLGGFAAQLGTGLPQRIVWFPCNEPRMPRSRPERQILPPTMPKIPPTGFFDGITLAVDTDILDELWRLQVEVQHGNLPAIASQRAFAQEKVAAAIALSEACFEVRIDHWERAAAIMKLSDATRERAMECQRAYALSLAKVEEEQRATVRAHGRFVGAIAEEQAGEDYVERVEQMRGRVLNALKSGPVAHRELARLCVANSSALPKAAFRAALTALESEGVIRRNPPGVEVGGEWSLANPA